MKLESNRNDIANSSVICPYDVDHVVPVSDLLLHLAKCRRYYYKQNGIKTDLKKCRYNGCHFIPAPEVTLHEMICHSRTLYLECKKKMRNPPIPLEIGGLSEKKKPEQNGYVQRLNVESDNDCPNLIAFD